MPLSLLSELGHRFPVLPTAPSSQDPHMQEPSKWAYNSAAGRWKRYIGQWKIFEDFP